MRQFQLCCSAGDVLLQFLLAPHIEEALQAVQAAMGFTSFDLAQGYLQMAMEEEKGVSPNP